MRLSQQIDEIEVSEFISAENNLASLARTAMPWNVLPRPNAVPWSHRTVSVGGAECKECFHKFGLLFGVYTSLTLYFQTPVGDAFEVLNGLLCFIITRDFPLLAFAEEADPHFTMCFLGVAGPFE